MKHLFVGALLFFHLLFWCSFLMGQAPATLWSRSYGLQQYEILCGAYELPSGDFLAGGYQQDTSTYDYEGWLFRVDADGNFLTDRHAGGAFYCMRQAPDSGFVLAGYDVRPSGSTGLYSMKIDTNANPIFWNVYGDDHIGYGAVALPSGQCVFVGEVTTTPNKGTLIWTFPHLGFMFQNLYDSFAWLELYSINRTLDSCLIVTGPVQINPFESRFFYLMKLDSLANCIGGQFYGFGGDDQIPYWVEATPDSGYIICGYTTVGGMLNQRDLYIVKVDPHLNQEWTKRYSDSEGRMIINHPGGGYVVVGNDRRPSGALIMRLDKNGDSLWSKTIPVGLGNSVSRTADGGYIVAGATLYTTAQKNDGFLARLGPEPTAIRDKQPRHLPIQIHLSQNYPNPFNPATAISFRLSAAGDVRLQICDLQGREVATLVNGRMSAGEHQIVWDARDYPSGLYFCRLTAGDFKAVKKMLLVK